MLAFVIGALVAMATIGDACMCMPHHPQESICSDNSFVALVKIRSEAHIKVLDVMKPSERKTSAGLISVLKKNENNVVEEDFLSQIVPTPPSKEVTLGKAGRKGKRADFVRYRIKIYKAYKGINTHTEKKEKFYLYTSADEGICGRTLTVRGTYLIAGSIVNGRLIVSLCNHVIQWKSISKAEKRNIRQNMQSINSVCKAGCQVQSCLWNDCSPKSHTECTWNSSMEKKYGRRFDRLNFLCAPGEKHRCDWRGLNFVDQKRLFRRRRHNKLRPHRRRYSPAVKHSAKQRLDVFEP